MATAALPHPQAMCRPDMEAISKKLRTFRKNAECYTAGIQRWPSIDPSQNYLPPYNARSLLDLFITVSNILQITNLFELTSSFKMQMTPREVIIFFN